MIISSNYYIIIINNKNCSHEYFMLYTQACFFLQLYLPYIPNPMQRFLL